MCLRATGRLGLLFMVIPTMVGFGQQEAATRAGGYQGWVHMMAPAWEGKDVVTHWDTRTGVALVEGHEAKGRAVAFLDLAVGERQVFVESAGSSGTVFICTMDKEWVEQSRRQAAAALTLPEVLAQTCLATGVRKEDLRLAESEDRGMRKIEITLPPEVETQFMPEPPRYFRCTFPATLWVDRETGLLREALVGEKRTTITYGGKAFASLEDAGVPKDSKQFDVRPDSDTVALYERIMTTMRTPPPDGVMAVVRLNPDSAQMKPGVGNLKAYWRAGENWGWRNYTGVHRVEDGTKGLVLPEDWEGKEAEELLKRLGEILPDEIFRSDGKEAWQAKVDPETGEEFYTVNRGTAAVVRDGKIVRIGPPAGARPSGPARIAGAQPMGTKAAAIGDSRESAMRLFYNSAASEAFFDYRCTLDRVVSRDRVGQVALHLQLHEAEGPDPNLVRLEQWLWIDTQFGDRPVSLEEVDYEAKEHKPEYRNTVDFSDYEQFPAPDGRWYPTRMTESLIRLQQPGPVDSQTTSVKFFPGKALGAIPKGKSPEGRPQGDKGLP